MKIGILHNNNYNYGGIENQILSLCDGMQELYQFVYFTSIADCAITNEMKRRNIPVVLLNGNLLKQLYKIRCECICRNIDILQLHTFDNSIKYRLAKIVYPRLKIVSRVHTYIACSWIPKWKKQLYYWADGITSFLIDRYIANGDYLKKEIVLKAGISSRKVDSVIDGTKYISLHDYNVTNVDLQSPHMIMIANLIPHKGHDTLIRAIADLRDKGIMVYCDVFGATDRNKEYTVFLNTLIEQYDLKKQIKFKGFSKNIQKEIISYPIVCLPSDSEGTPNCIMEGMSAKRLVIVSNTGGIPEMIQHGETGFVHSPCDFKDMADVIELITKTDSDRINEIMNNGFDFWKTHFSLDVMCDKFDKIYHKL